MRAFKKLFQDLRITRVDADRSHAIPGAMVRVYFQLSEPSPLGWSYMFTTVWQAVTYPAKCPACVEGNPIWIDCRPEDVETHHLAQLERAVAQTNAKYQDAASQQALKASRQAELNAELQLRLNDLNRTLYPSDDLSDRVAPTPRLLGSKHLATLVRLLFGENRRKSDT